MNQAKQLLLQYVQTVCCPVCLFTEVLRPFCETYHCRHGCGYHLYSAVHDAWLFTRIDWMKVTTELAG
jgi:hypothetical protein